VFVLPPVFSPECRLEFNVTAGVSSCCHRAYPAFAFGPSTGAGSLGSVINLAL